MHPPLLKFSCTSFVFSSCPFLVEFARLSVFFFCLFSFFFFALFFFLSFFPCSFHFSIFHQFTCFYSFKRFKYFYFFNQISVSKFHWRLSRQLFVLTYIGPFVIAIRLTRRWAIRKSFCLRPQVDKTVASNVIGFAFLPHYEPGFVLSQ